LLEKRIRSFENGLKGYIYVSLQEIKAAVKMQALTSLKFVQETNPEQSASLELNIRFIHAILYVSFFFSKERGLITRGLIDNPSIQ
jgi:hypothetical protein